MDSRLRGNGEGEGDWGGGWLEGELVVGCGGGDGDVEVLGELGKFADDSLLVAGIPVDGDDVGKGKVSASGGFEFILEDGGCEVLAGASAVYAVVRVGDLDEEDLGWGIVGEEGLEAAAGVAGEGGRGRAFSDHKANGGSAVGHGEGENFEATEFEGVVGNYGVEAVLGSFGGWAEGEVGVEKAVEKSGGYGFEGVGERVYFDGGAVVYGLEAEAGEVSDVVEVSMGEEDGFQ